jgi:hypothetical protein
MASSLRPLETNEAEFRALTHHDEQHSFGGEFGTLIYDRSEHVRNTVTDQRVIGRHRLMDGPW